MRTAYIIRESKGLDITLVPLVRINTEEDAYGDQPDGGATVRSTLHEVAQTMGWEVVEGQTLAHPYYVRAINRALSPYGNKS